MQPLGKTRIQHGTKKRSKREKGERKAQNSGARSKAKVEAKRYR